MNPRSPDPSTATTTRITMWALLGTVAASAAVLSFAAQRDLAELCGFSTHLSWLLPVTVDAGAAAGCLVWLGVNAPTGARAYARTLTLFLLASSVGGNAVEHYLTAYRLLPSWQLVVAVSAVAPAVLGAVVHLAVLVSRPTGQHATEVAAPVVSEGADSSEPAEELKPAPKRAPADTRARAAALLERNPTVGRRTLMRELDITDHAAKTLLADLRPAVKV